MYPTHKNDRHARPLYPGKHPAARLRVRALPLAACLGDRATDSPQSGVRPDDRHLTRQGRPRVPPGRRDLLAHANRSAARSDLQLPRRHGGIKCCLDATELHRHLSITARLRGMARTPELGLPHETGGPERMPERRVWPRAESISQVAGSSSHEDIPPLNAPRDCGR